jgi:uncharacterized membrane protein (UPF0127 family)
MENEISFRKIPVLPAVLLFSFFLLAVLATIVLPENASARTKQLDGLTLIATRNQNDLALGLQYVTKMPKNVGVLFSGLGRQASVFHCHNCLFVIEMTALDKNGKILQIVNAPPETDKVKMPEGTGYVIETNANVIRRKGFKVGDKIRLGSLKKSVDSSLNIENDLPRIQSALH